MVEAFTCPYCGSHEEPYWVDGGGGVAWLCSSCDELLPDPIEVTYG